MLKRPTSRRKSNAGGIQINLVPILDTMVTLIGFLLFTTSFIALVSIESPLPVIRPEKNQDLNPEQPLQLTLTLRENEVEISSPFHKIKPKTIPNQEGKADTKAIHESLLEIKKLFPKELTVVLIPSQFTLYDSLIALMDAARLMTATDPPIYLKNEQTGYDEPIKQLFPKVVFGNLLENS